MSPIITLHAPHRNVGKSFLTANLAILLAQQGHRVGIIELDCVSDLPMLFGLDPLELAQRWTTLQKPGGSLSEDTWLPVGAGAIALLTGGGEPSEPASGFSLVNRLKDQPQINRLSQELTHLIPRLQADYVLIETFPGFNENGFLAFALADVLLLVLNPTVQDYQDTAVFVDLAQRLQVQQVALVASQVAPDLDVEQLVESLANAYQIPVLGTLTTVKPIEHSKYPHLLCQAQPAHAYSQGLQEVASKLLTLSQEANAGSPEE